MKKVLFYLSLSVCVIVPFSNDIFVSAIPEMSQFFHTNRIPLIISIFLLGLALSQPFYGPLSDRYGRKPVLLIGLIIFTLSSLAIVLTDSFPILVAARFVQALGACSAIVSALAIIRDACKPEEIVKATAIVMALIGVCPAIAPLLGSYFTTHWGWRSNFIYMLILGVFFTFIILFSFKETIANKNMDAHKIKHIGKNYLELLQKKALLNYCITSGFSYGALFSYFALSALFIIEQFKFSIIQYGWIVALNAVAIILMSIFAPKMARKITLAKTVFIGSLVLISGGIIMAATNYFFDPTIYSFMLPMFLCTLGIGTIRPTASGGAMSESPKKIAGSAAALFNFTSFAGGAIATTIASLLARTPYRFGLFIVILGIFAAYFSAKNLKSGKVVLNE